MSRRPARPFSPGMVAAIVVLATLVQPGPLLRPASVTAQPAADGLTCLAVPEPNDEPVGAPAASGDLCASGQLPSNDQDLLFWELPAAMSGRPLAITLEGVPGTLTSLRFLPVTSPAGSVPVEVASEILVVDSPPEAQAPVTLPDLLLPAGRYLLGISRSERADGARPWSLDYGFSIAAGELPALALDAQTSRSPRQGEFSLGGTSSVGETATIVWTVDRLEPATAWYVDALSVLGSGTLLRLEAPDGRTLVERTADAHGRLTFPDLVLPPATYRLLVVAPAEEAMPFTLSAGVENRRGDAEPNDLPGLAGQFGTWPVLARGRIFPAGDQDNYLLEIPPEQTGLLGDVRLISTAPSRRSLCLTARDGSRLQCREGATSLTLPGLLLDAGPYVVTVSGDADAELDLPGAISDGYVLRVETTAMPASDFEIEPNDDPALASRFDQTLGIRARGEAGDRDVFRFIVEGEPQLWEATADGGVDELAWIRADGTVLGRSEAVGDGLVSVTDMYLVPGEHLLSVIGGAEYSLHAKDLGPPDPDAEREPNDGAEFAQPWRLSRPRVTGRLATSADVDVFRLSLAGRERLKLHLDPPQDAAIDLRLESDRLAVGGARSGGVGVATDYDLLLGPGDFDVFLALAPGSEPYELTLPEHGSRHDRP